MSPNIVLMYLGLFTDRRVKKLYIYIYIYMQSRDGRLQFLRYYLKASRPDTRVAMVRAVERWKLATKWDVDYIQRCIAYSQRAACDWPAE